MITKESLRNGIIGLGITSVIAGGIVGYFSLGKDYLTWEEYQNLIIAYNYKIQEIKKDCDIDIRCVKENGVPKVIFEGVKDEKDIVNKINKWINNDNKNPKTYKKQ